MEEVEHEIAVGRLKEKKVMLASQDKVDSLQYEREEILQVIGHPEALIIDESSIRDFTGSEVNAGTELVVRIEEGFGIDVTDVRELLVDLAARVRKARRSPS